MERDGGSGRIRRPFTATEALTATAGTDGGRAFLFDFDGTLAPIADDPDLAAPVPGVIELISALADGAARVAIVSARQVSFLAAHFTSARSGLDLYGVYGLETSSGGRTVTDPAALPWLDTIRQLAIRAEAELPATTLVEYKRVSVALHFRRAPQTAPLVTGWAQDRAVELGLRVQPGRMVVELKPPAARDKGTVVRTVTAGVDTAWYFGDDVSDLAAFAALADREAADPGFLGVRVAVANPESGHQVAAEADLTVPAPEQVLDLLAEIVHALIPDRPGRSG